MTRVSPGTMTAAIFAVLIGLGGAYAVRQYLHQPILAQKAAEPRPPVMVTIPVASNNLILGRKLTDNDLIVLRMSPEEFRKSPYAGKQFMTTVGQIAGRVLRGPIEKGSVFLTTDLFPDGMGPGVADLLRPGYRAVTIPIHSVSAVAGFARPGSTVDVLFRSEAHANYAEVTMTLVEKAQVLAVGRGTVPGHDTDLTGTGNRGRTSQAKDLGTVTLGVSPNQARALKVVEGRGELTLTLRSANESSTMSTSLSSTEKVTLAQLLGLPFIKRTTQIDIYRGGQKTPQKFEESVPVNRDFGGALISTPIASEVVTVHGGAAEGSFNHTSSTSRSRRYSHHPTVSNSGALQTRGGRD